jgi:hypothetical protein
MEPLSNLLVKFRFSSQKPCLLLNNVFGELVFVTEAPLLEPQSVTVTSRDLRQREPRATVIYTIRVTGRSFPSAPRVRTAVLIKSRPYAPIRVVAVSVPRPLRWRALLNHWNSISVS